MIGTGVVRMRDGSYRDVQVYAYFTFNRWKFIIHRCLEEPQYFTVSEASTGYRLQDESYYEVSDALHFALQFCEKKKYYFATTVGDTLVNTQTSVCSVNTTGIRTPAIHTALWL